MRQHPSVTIDPKTSRGIIPGGWEKSCAFVEQNLKLGLEEYKRLRSRAETS